MGQRRREATRCIDWEKWSDALRLIHHDHAEIYSHSRTGEQILVRCECPIGHDHGYQDWSAEFPGTEQVSRHSGKPLGSLI